MVDDRRECADRLRLHSKFPAPHVMPMRCSPRRRRRDLRSALERVGGGLRRLADHRWQCGARLQHRDLEHLRHRGWRRLSHLAVHDRRFCAGRRRHELSVANSGSGHSDLFQAGAFIRHTVGPAYVSAALAYGWQDITTNRTVTAAGSDQLRAQFDANAFSGRLEGGYRFVAPWVGGIGITPYAAAQFTTFDLPAYAEQAIVGSNAFALAYNAKDVTDTRSELGIRTDKSLAMSDGILILRSRFAWAHDYNPDRSIAATFQTLPGASFVVNGAAQASDSALVTASVEKKWLNGWSAAATFEGEFSDVTRSYAGKGVVRYQW